MLWRARIVGVARVGRVLVCAGVRVRGASSLTFSWRRDGRAIPKARGTRYRVRQADRGRLVSCAVRVRGAGLTLTTVSRPVRVHR